MRHILKLYVKLVEARPIYCMR